MKRLRDRKDAKRIDKITGMSQIMIDLKPDRCDSDVFINQQMDLTKLTEYVKAKKLINPDITFFHTFVCAIGKLMYNRPKLNRFVSNRHVYEHNDVVVSFVAKIAFEEQSEQMMIMIPIKEDDNLESISKKIKEKVTKVRTNNEKKGANSAIDTLSKLPNIIRIPILGLFKWLDKKGKLPKSLVKDNLYYSSIIISNLGSIHCGAIYHNITNFGTCSSLATMGEIKDREILVDGTRKIIKACDFGVNIDERIADGYYFAKSVQLLQYIFDNPECLDNRCDEIIDIKKGI